MVSIFGFAVGFLIKTVVHSRFWFYDCLKKYHTRQVAKCGQKITYTVIQ